MVVLLTVRAIGLGNCVPEVARATLGGRTSSSSRSAVANRRSGGVLNVWDSGLEFAGCVVGGTLGGFCERTPKDRKGIRGFDVELVTMVEKIRLGRGAATAGRGGKSPGVADGLEVDTVGRTTMVQRGKGLAHSGKTVQVEELVALDAARRRCGGTFDPRKVGELDVELDC